MQRTEYDFGKGHLTNRLANINIFIEVNYSSESKITTYLANLEIAKVEVQTPSYPANITSKQDFYHKNGANY